MGVYSHPVQQKMYRVRENQQEMQHYLIFSLLILFFCKKAETLERDVFAHIFENYEKRMRPLRNESQVMKVQIQLNMISLLEVNALQEYIKLALNFIHYWHDDFLTWDPSQFNGTTRIRVPASMVWQPDVTIISTVLEAEYIIAKEDQFLHIQYDGAIFHSFPIVLTNHCPMKTDNYPFDSQECIIILSSWIYTNDELYLEHTGTQTSIQNNNSEWNVYPYTNETTTYWSDGKPVGNLNYHQVISRKASYYVWVIMVPSFIITALSLAGIFAPFNNTGDREEKTTLGLTTLLTLAVLLSMVTAEMPRTTNLPLLGYFLLFEISICVFSMALSVVIIFLHQRATTRDWKVPNWLRKAACCKGIRFYDDEPLVKQAFHDMKRKENKWTDKQKTLIDVQQLTELTNAISQLNHHLDHFSKMEQRNHQWTMIFDRIDLAFFLGFQLVHILQFLIVIIPRTKL